MKILLCPVHYVFDDGDRGSELSWAYKIADSIASLYDNSIIVTGSKNIKNKKNYSIIELQSRKKDVDLGIINAFTFNIRYSWFSFWKLRSGNFDVLHHILPFGIDKTFNLAFIFGGKNVVKIIGPIQNPLPFYRDNIYDLRSKKQSGFVIWCTKTIFSLLNHILKYLSVETLKKADKIIVINQETKKMLLVRGIDSEKIITIPPGIDCAAFVPPERFSFSNENCLKVFSVGALIERKGFDLVIDAVAEVVRSGMRITVKIAGDGPQREFLMKKVKELGLEECIIFEGLINYSSMKSYYQEADVFVSMSRAESWGQMYVEAMACGLPVIATKNVGSNEIIKDGETGYLINQEDYRALAEKIKFFISERKVLKEFSERSRKVVEENYDWNKVVIPQYMKIYNELIK